MSGYNLRHRTGVSVPSHAQSSTEFPDYTRKPDQDKPSCKVVTYDRSKFPKDRYKANWRLYPKGCKIRGLLTSWSHGQKREPYVAKTNKDGKRKTSADFRLHGLGIHTYVQLGVGDDPETLHKASWWILGLRSRC